MKLIKITTLLFLAILFLGASVKTVKAADEIVVIDADSVWTQDLTSAPPDAIDSTDTPPQNLIKWAFVSHADTVLSIGLGKPDWVKPPEPEKWSFAIITDLHIGDGILDYGDSAWNDDASGQEPILSTSNLRTTINLINSNKDKYNIAFVVVLGDLTDSAELSELNKAQEILDEIEVPWIPIMGNHDAWPYTVFLPSKAPEAGTGDAGTDKFFNDIFNSQYEKLANVLQDWEKADIPIWNSETKPEHYSYFQNFAFDYNNYHFIGLDFNYRDDAPWGFGVSPEGELYDFSEGTWSWLKNHLQQYLTNYPESYENIIFLGHHPFRKVYWKEIFGKGFFNIGFSDKELDIIKNFLINYKDKIYGMFAGHSHETRDYFWPEDAAQIIETGANTEGPLVRIVQIYPDGKIDYSKMLPEKMMLIKAFSPIDLEIIDPDGLIINKQSNKIPGATYFEEDINGDGEVDDLIAIPNRKLGDYQIKVIAEPNAEPSDTYTLEVSTLEDSFGYAPIILAENVPIKEIPTEPYTFEVKERQITHLAYTGDSNGLYSDSVNLSATLTNKDGNPLANKTIVFEIGEQSVSAIANSEGIANSSLALNQTPGKYYFLEASFSGDEEYLPSSDSKPFHILESARWFKVDAIEKLEAIETSNKKTQKDIEKAMEYIKQSLNESLWLDSSHLDSQSGHKVFDHEKNAVKELLKIVEEKGTHTDQTIANGIQAVIGKIIKADDLLAHTAISDAKNVPGIDPKFQKQVEQEIDRAENELNKAYEELGKNKPDKAIDHFKKTWEHAQLAIKFANLEKIKKS